MNWTKEQILEIFEKDELLHPSPEIDPDDLMNLHLDLAELILKGYAELFFDDNNRPMVRATAKAYQKDMISIPLRRDHSAAFFFTEIVKKTIPIQIPLLTFTPEMLN